MWSRQHVEAIARNPLLLSFCSRRPCHVLFLFPSSPLCVPSERLISSGFPPSLSAMGKSRSSTLVIAYLLSTNPNLTPSTALSLLREGHPVADPNLGFMSQLKFYHEMKCPEDLDAEPKYQRWCYWRAVKGREWGKAPEIEKLRFGDEVRSEREREGGGEEQVMLYRCRLCRQQLASTPYLLLHPREPSSSSKVDSGSPASAVSSQPCAHLFLEQPMSWMRAELEQGKLEGRLECPNPKCKTQVGRYAWQGLKCSCGEWVSPGISLASGKIDEVRDRG